MTDDDAIELCTLLHQVAAGPAKDLRLAEWVIHMGALMIQPLHCRDPDAMDELRARGNRVGHLPNGLAVHAAAENGDLAMVRLLLETNNQQDLNTTTYRTKESLVHIAVKVGNRAMLSMLWEWNADITTATAAGRHAWELTPDPSWQKVLRQMAQWQCHKSRTMSRRGTREVSDEKAELLHKALQSQRDAEHTAASAAGRRKKTRVLVQSGKTPRASAVLVLLERRLLAVVPRGEIFRLLATVYAEARQELGVQPHLGSTHAVRQELAWFVNKHGVTDMRLLAQLDWLHRCSVFLKLRVRDEIAATLPFARFLETVASAVDAHGWTYWNVLFVDGHVVAGAPTRGQYTEAERVIKETAELTGVSFSENSKVAVSGAAAIELLGYVFSGKGIHPVPGSSWDLYIKNEGH